MSTPTPILLDHRELLIRELRQAEEYGDIYLVRQIADSLCHIEDLLWERGADPRTIPTTEPKPK